MTNLRKVSMIFVYIVSLHLMVIFAAVAHKHVHHNGNHERLEDGSFRPRDAGHHADNGEHMIEFDHEAILGSVKEAEEFDQLPADESKRRLGILVKKMDLNKDDFIDRHELKAHILRSFKTLSEEESNDRFDDIDEDHDDRLTWHEYIKDTYSMDADQLPSMKLETDDHSGRYIVGNEESRLVDEDKTLFSAADKNGDGALARDEFVMFVSPEEFPEMLPVILNQTLRDKDKNFDGKISFQEFIGDTAKEHDKEWLIAEKERFDHEYDLDRDGLLSSNEILSWVVPSNDEVAGEEVNHLFVAADNNHDNRLSYQEIIDNHDTFVGSEATDYGDHLQNIHKFKDEL